MECPILLIGDLLSIRKEEIVAEDNGPHIIHCKFVFVPHHPHDEFM